jgi:hypothetical protein
MHQEIRTEELVSNEVRDAAWRESEGASEGASVTLTFIISGRGRETPTRKCTRKPPAEGFWMSPNHVVSPRDQGRGGWKRVVRPPPTETLSEALG